MSSFGRFIKSEREKNSWTQTEFGAKIGINSSAISRIENGTQRFSTSKLEILAKIFDADLLKLKDLFFADKFAHEAYENGCGKSVFQTAEHISKHLRNKHSKQGNFDI